MAERHLKERRPTIAGKGRRRKQQRLVVGTLALVILVILGVGVYQAVKSRTSIATVNGVGIRVDTYQKQILYLQRLEERTIERLEREWASLDPNDENYDVMEDYYDRTIAQMQQDSYIQTETKALDELIDDELIRQGTERMGVIVSEEEIQQGIYDVFSASLSDTDSTSLNERSPPLSQEEFEKLYELEVAYAKESLGMTEDEFRDVFERQALRDKMSTIKAEQVPSTAQQVHAKHILVASEEEAKAVVARLEKGEDFTAIANELSLDQRAKDKGGDLGWFPRGTYPPVFEDAVFALVSEGDVGIVKDSSGFHIVILVASDPDRPLDPDAFEHRRKDALRQWLQAQRLEADISYNMDLFRKLFMQ